MYCWMEEPSVEAKYLSSLRSESAAVEEKTFAPFLASSETRRRRPSFSAIGMAKGSLSCGVAQRSRYALTGGSWTGLGWLVAFARAMMTASPGTRAISAGATVGGHAKP